MHPDATYQSSTSATQGSGDQPWVALPGGQFPMGSDKHYPEEAQTHRVRGGAFSIAAHQVTNRQFAQFCAPTPTACGTDPRLGGRR